MDNRDRLLRFVILVLYALAATQMLWSGAVYQLVMPQLAPVLAVTALLFWLFAVSEFPRLRGRRESGGHAAGGAADHGDGAGSGDGPEASTGVWLTGALYALFALPAAAYLLDAVLR